MTAPPPARLIQGHRVYDPRPVGWGRADNIIHTLEGTAMTPDEELRLECLKLALERSDNGDQLVALAAKMFDFAKGGKPDGR